jgi:hypothetical protein
MAGRDNRLAHGAGGDTATHGQRHAIVAVGEDAKWPRRGEATWEAVRYGGAHGDDQSKGTVDGNDRHTWHVVRASGLLSLKECMWQAIEGRGQQASAWVVYRAQMQGIPVVNAGLRCTEHGGDRLGANALMGGPPERTFFFDVEVLVFHKKYSKLIAPRVNYIFGPSSFVPGH